MTLQQCRYIVELSKHDSMSKAAAALYVTQPSLSKAVQEVEEEMGITILIRTNRGIRFTEQGKELLFYAKMLLEQAEAITFHFHKRSPQDMIKFAVSSQHYTFVTAAFVNMMQRLETKHYELTLREGKIMEVIEDVASRKSILGILAFTKRSMLSLERYFASNSLEFMPLVTFDQKVVMRAGHPLAALPKVTYEQLQEYPCLTYQKEDVLLNFAEETAPVERMERIVYLGDRGTMNNILTHTNGYNIGTGYLIPEYMDGHLTAVPLEGGSKIEVGFVRRQDVFLAQEHMDFIRSIRGCLQELEQRHVQ